MAEVVVPPEIRRFLLACIPSVPHLEALLLAHAQPRAWSVGEISARLYVDEETAAQLVRDLQEAGLLASSDGGVRFVADEARTQLIDALAAFYSRNVVAVSHLIHSAMERKAHRFADAFRLRKGGS